MGLFSKMGSESALKPLRKTADKVVALENEGLRLGNPYLEGASVTCKVEKQGKEKKVVIFKYKQKKGSTRRRQGHRQPYTKLTVESIEA